MPFPPSGLPEVVTALPPPRHRPDPRDTATSSCEGLIWGQPCIVKNYRFYSQQKVKNCGTVGSLSLGNAEQLHLARLKQSRSRSERRAAALVRGGTQAFVEQCPSSRLCARSFRTFSALSMAVPSSCVLLCSSSKQGG